MSWIPADLTGTCTSYPTVTSCQPALLTFIAFITQNFGHSVRHNDPIVDNDFIESQEYDFIIVGAGSAGCVLANRLTELSDWKVLLLEAGDEEPLATHVPAFTNLLSKSSIDWNYKTQPELNGCKAYKNSACDLVRGKVMGGSSSINGLSYIRGNKEDYDEWARLGNAGWSFRDVLPYFKKSEHIRIPKFKSDRQYHGKNGPMGVDWYPYMDVNNEVILEAMKELGFPEVDPNSYNQIGVSRSQVMARIGVRTSANKAFIEPIRRVRPNLFVKTNARVTKILIDDDPKNAVGVEYSDENYMLRQVFAKKEIIVSAGAINSPQLLMLSGIGPTFDLKRLGIDVIQDLAVGNNLQDHVSVTPFIAKLDPSRWIMIDEEGMVEEAMGWLNNENHPLSGTDTHTSVVTFDRTSFESKPGVPDVQYNFKTMILEDFEAVPNNVLPNSYVPSCYYNAFIFGPDLLNVKSRGKVMLNETDPWGPPLIYSNYLTHPEDLAVVVEGCTRLRQIFNTEIFKFNGFEQYSKPLDACKHITFNSPDYYACVAINYSRAGNQMVGTCKMGPAKDPEAVVDSRLNVRGINKLRVIDESIMPVLPRGNINAVMLMIGEKGADMIKEDWLD